MRYRVKTQGPGLAARAAHKRIQRACGRAERVYPMQQSQSLQRQLAYDSSNQKQPLERDVPSHLRQNGE